MNKEAEESYTFIKTYDDCVLQQIRNTLNLFVTNNYSYEELLL